MLEYRRLPHLKPFASQPIVFLTSVTHERRPLLADAGAREILTQLWSRSSELDGWFVGDYLLMPDHVHLLARAAVDAKPLSQWIQAWKSISSRQITARLQLPPPIWQRDYFDRYLRSSDNYTDKWNYIAMNPVRRGLCGLPENWPWKGRLFDLKY